MDGRRTTVISTLVVLTLVSGVMAWFMMQNTFVNPCNVFGISALSALLLFPLSGRWWKRMLGTQAPAVAALAAEVIVTTTVIAAAFYILNFAFASGNEAEPGVVRSVYSQERHHKRRVGRGRYIDGEAYHVYKADVSVRCKLHTTVTLDYSSYRRIHAGDTIDMRVRRGLFGFDVVQGMIEKN